MRAQLVKSRTALCNQLRGLLRERGVVVRTGAAALKRSLPAALADESSELSGEMRELLSEMSQWLRTLEQRIASCEARITRKFKYDERCQRLAAVPGVGPLTATALVAAVGNAQRFRNGRELSAYLGLVPRQHSSGGETVLLGITKRGDRYLRTLLIHGRAPRSDSARATRAVGGRGASAPSADLTWPRSHWPTRMRGYCGRCSPEVTVTARPTQPHMQFCAPALHPRLRERGAQNCVCAKTDVGT